MELTEFLLARIAEDEAAFSLPEWRSDIGGDWTLSGDDFFANYWPDNTVQASIYRGDERVAESGIVSRASRAECQAFAEQWIREHSRALAECEATRRMVAMAGSLVWGGDESSAEAEILAVLARPYADHPDFDPAWATAGEDSR